MVNVLRYEEMETNLDLLCMEKFKTCSIQMEDGDVSYATGFFDPRTSEPFAIIIGNPYCGRNKTIERIVAIAHEMGHFEDYVDNYKKDLPTFEKGTKNAIECVSQEIRAWIYGVRFLKTIEFDRWDTFEAMVDKHLRSYIPRQGKFNIAKLKIMKAVDQPEWRAIASI